MQKSPNLSHHGAYRLCLMVDHFSIFLPSGQRNNITLNTVLESQYFSLQFGTIGPTIY